MNKELEEYVSKNWFYILDDDHRVRKTHNMAEWGKWMEKFGKNRIIRQTLLKNNCWVSTVFLGVDYNWTGKGEPIVFETMVFDKNVIHQYALGDEKPRDDIGEELYQTRYTSYDKALRGHKQAVRKFAGRPASKHRKFRAKRVRAGVFDSSLAKLAGGQQDSGGEAALRRPKDKAN